MTHTSDILARHAAVMRLAVFLLAPLALAGCRHVDTGPQVAGWSLIEPSQRHPIMVSQQPATLTLAVNRGAEGLTPGQRAEVIDFAQRFRASDAGNSRLVISAPSGAANEVAAMAAVDEIRDITLQSGFSEAGVAVEAYSAEGRSAPVRISYMRYVAEGPECGTTWTYDRVERKANLPSQNFGCAQQHNLAAMVSNPADLLGPRNETERYAPRRDAVYDKYVKGVPSGATRSGDEQINTQGGN